MPATYAQRRALGSYGERLAAEHLASLGYTVLDRNWRCHQGEIDIVARDEQDLVVCEVKTRSSDRYGTAIEAITEDKAARLHRLGFAWAASHATRFTRLRIDVVTVLLERRASATVSHYRGVA